MAKTKHNPSTDLPNELASQEAIREADEAALREAVEALIGESVATDSEAAVRTACVMGLLAIKYESRQLDESPQNFSSRRNDIMATAVKQTLKKDLGKAKEQRKAATTPVKAAAAAKPAGKKADASAEAPAKRGRAAAINKIKINPEGGESKLNAGSERAQVLELIKKAGAKGITIETLDQQFAEVLKADKKEAKATRPFVLKLLEKSWVIVLD